MVNSSQQSSDFRPLVIRGGLRACREMQRAAGRGEKELVFALTGREALMMKPNPNSDD